MEPRQRLKLFLHGLNYKFENYPIQDIITLTIDHRKDCGLEFKWGINFFNVTEEDVTNIIFEYGKFLGHYQKNG
jgi:hypothetical protein